MVLFWHLIVTLAIVGPIFALHWLVLHRPHQELIDAKTAAAVARYNFQAAVAVASLRAAREKDYGI